MNNLSGTRIEFHILQSFPVTCLNRDDVGSPKSAVVGGVERARVSSQCWKRQVRMALHELGKDVNLQMGVRTKDIAGMLKEAMLEAGATEEQALSCAEPVASALSDNTLLFFSRSEANAIAQEAKKNEFDINKLGTLSGKDDKKKASAKDSKKNEDGKEEKKKFTLSKELKKVLREALNPAVDGLDIALFGRMVAQEPDMNMQAAASFAHAISTHKSTNEVEFFTALDDRSRENETGSAHMGALEFNSATYYRFISLDLGQLFDNLHGRNLGKAVETFVKALYKAVPSARQTTQTGLRPWDFARVQIRKGQGMQVSFDKPVRSSQEGYLEPSKEELNNSIALQESRSGSLYGKLDGQDYVFGGEDLKMTGVNKVNIDELANNLGDFAKKFEKTE